MQDLIESLYKKIDEKENTIESLRGSNNRYKHDYEDQKFEIERLQKQISEKDEKIEALEKAVKEDAERWSKLAAFINSQDWAKNVKAPIYITTWAQTWW